MGHSGSVHRPRHGASGASSGGVLYGEPVGAANGANSQANYTPAQLQALYLSRGRPDLAFMTNQSSFLPNQVPEMQQTSTVKNHVNLKKSTLKLVPSKDSDRPGRYVLEFMFDATKPCRIKVYVAAIETIDDDTGCSSFSLAHPERELITTTCPDGLGQQFSTAEVQADGGCCVDVGELSASELVYDSTASLRFPLIVVLEVQNTGRNPQSQATFATFVKKTGNEWGVKVLKQKIQVDGMTYELQEIYGIDGAVTAAPKNDGEPDEAGEKKTAKSDEVEIPDGAECIICMCEPRNTTVLPCRHMCLCGECAEALRRSSSTCPICRTRVEALLQIRVGAKGTDDDEK
ncbi:hypothetical protein PINS_up008208 [Pythium insidiosum]|nr:hypothetical protein PINS_up008208 [Pythium insidiosum]